MEINKLITDFSVHPFDPEISFSVAQEYEKMGQTAAAISFYLRTAEYGYGTHVIHAYTSLLRMSKCFELQSNRELTVSGVLLQAVALMPKRPEAYFLMSKFYEKTSQWQESYTWAVMSKSHENTHTYVPLPTDVEYNVGYSPDYQISVCAYWVGRLTESVSGLKDFVSRGFVAEKYSTEAMNNLGRIANDKI